MSRHVDYRPNDLIMLKPTFHLTRTAIEQAYLNAEGPADFERRLNISLRPSEIPLSVAVYDVDDHHQIVSGFFDTDENGIAESNEVQFQITRRIYPVELDLTPEARDPTSKP